MQKSITHRTLNNYDYAKCVLSEDYIVIAISVTYTPYFKELKIY